MTDEKKNPEDEEQSEAERLQTVPAQLRPDDENLPEHPTPQGPTLPANYPTEGIQKGDERKTDEELNPTPQGPTRTSGPEGVVSEDNQPDGTVDESV